MNWLYLLLNIGTISIPFIFTFHPKLQFQRRWKGFFAGIALVSTFFVLWDIWFTSIGIWGFNSEYLLGINVFNLPLEEVLFFVCIPYACVYTYHCLDVLIDGKRFETVGWYAAIALCAFSVVMALQFYDRLYTVTTFSLLALTLIVLVRQRAAYLGMFLVSWVVLQVPFFLVNGVLTGSWIDDQVVWYNPHQQIDIRLGTIPFEDTFYGLLLCLGIVAVMERISPRSISKNSSS